MIDINNKKCRCGKSQAFFNEPQELVGICCCECKTSTMVDVKSKKCRCGKSQAFFNEPQELVGICCCECKTSTMVDVKSKKCRCGKSQAFFNEPQELVGICCSQCKTSTMIDIKNKKCLGYTNDTSIGCPFSRHGNTKYKNYCIECYRRNFPLDPLTYQIRSKTKEIAVRDFINENFDGFQHDTTLWTSHCQCNIKRRIDHRKLIGNTLLVIETDENQQNGRRNTL
jgi:hypothetical protein